MRFSPGDEVQIVAGDFAGYVGQVDRFEDFLEVYMVRVNTAKASGLVACREDEIDYPEDQVGDEVPVPTFPASVEDVRNHLEWLLPRVLNKVGEVGPEQALFGFQQFEGQTPSAILVALMEKIEDSMAMHTQVHILLGRIVIALETLHDQNS